MHREDIKAKIRKRGKTLRELSREAGLCDNAVTLCLRKPQVKANFAVAKFLDMPVHEIWPEWYDRFGKRIYIRRFSSNNHNKKHPRRHCQKRTPKSTGAAK